MLCSFTTNNAIQHNDDWEMSKQMFLKSLMIITDTQDFSKKLCPSYFSPVVFILKYY